jgi:hypothetical protein
MKRIFIFEGSINELERVTGTKFEVIYDNLYNANVDEDSRSPIKNVPVELRTVSYQSFEEAREALARLARDEGADAVFQVHYIYIKSEFISSYIIWGYCARVSTPSHGKEPLLCL